MHRSTAIKARPTGITANAAARRSGSAMSNGLNWCTRLPRRSIRSCPRRLRACICCCATKRAGSNHRSAPMTNASTAIPHYRSKTGTKNTGCGSNDGTFQETNRRHLVFITEQARGPAYRLSGFSVGRLMLQVREHLRAFRELISRSTEPHLDRTAAQRLRASTSRISRAWHRR